MSPSADSIDVGSPAPDFTLPASDSSLHALSSHRGREPVLLYFLRAFT